VIDKALEVVDLKAVGMVDCGVEIGQSLAADGRNVGIHSILSRASRPFNKLNQTVITGNARERTAEAFFVQSD